MIDMMHVPYISIQTSIFKSCILKSIYYENKKLKHLIILQP